MSHVADALVLVLPDGTSPGSLEREGQGIRCAGLWGRLARHYRRTVLAWRGSGPDAADQAAAGTWGERMRVSFDLEGGADPSVAIASRLSDARTVIVRTEEFDAARTALRIHGELLSRGKQAGLVARGTYPWSREMAFRHGPDSAQAWEAASLERPLCVAADVLVAPSGATLDDLAWRYMLNPALLAPCPDYVPMPRGADRTRRGDLVASTGPLEAHRRCDVLVRAVAALDLPGRDRPELVLAGDGPEAAGLLELAGSLGVRLRIEPSADDEAVSGLLASCTLYVQPCPATRDRHRVLSAMAHGASVLILDKPGPSVVDHGISGIRVHPDADALARAMEELLSDPEWCDMLGSGARGAMVSRHDADAVERAEVSAHRRALRGARDVRVAS